MSILVVMVFLLFQVDNFLCVLENIFWKSS